MKKYNVTVNGTKYEVVVEVADANSISTAPAKTEAPAAAPAPASNANGETVKSPMPGTILKVNVQNGSAVKKGDTLMILEAMKMENEIISPCDGTIASLNVQSGAAVETGATLCVIA